jgi:hypothetical protein
MSSVRLILVLEGSYGGRNSLRWESSSFYLSPHASKTPLVWGTAVENQVSAALVRLASQVQLEQSHAARANAPSLQYHTAHYVTESQIHVLFVIQ